MKNKIAIALCATLLLGSNMSVYAADVTVKSEPFTATTPSTLVVDETQAGATIKLPANIELTYDEAYGAFQYKNKIYCDGVIAAGSCIAVECPERVTYTGENTSEELEAFVMFNDSNVGCFSQNDLENDIGRELLVQIPGTSVATADTFTGTVNFKISMAAEGMYTTHATALTYYENIKYNGYANTFAFDDDITETHITLNNLMALNIDDGKYAAIYSREGIELDSVKYVELASNNSTYYPTYFTQKSVYYKDDRHSPDAGSPGVVRTASTVNLYASALKGPFIHMKNLASIAVPNNITKEQLRSQLYWPGDGTPSGKMWNSGVWLEVPNYWEHNLLDKGTPIGDAYLFVKGINDNNSWIYIPNIAFRGTMAEWKALSANGEDWVFGNKANIVTVHCTDGRLYY